MHPPPCCVAARARLYASHSGARRPLAPVSPAPRPAIIPNDHLLRGAHCCPFAAQSPSHPAVADQPPCFGIGAHLLVLEGRMLLRTCLAFRMPWSVLCTAPSHLPADLSTHAWHDVAGLPSRPVSLARTVTVPKQLLAWQRDGRPWRGAVKWGQARGHPAARTSHTAAHRPASQRGAPRTAGKVRLYHLYEPANPPVG